MTPAKKAVPSLADLGKKDDEKGYTTELPDTANTTDDTTENSTSVVPDDDEDENEDPNLDSDESLFGQEDDKENNNFLSPEVIATVPNRTPAELAAESADETAARYNIDSSITEEDARNPRVQVYSDTRVMQVPSGTHLHPDIAKDNANRQILEQQGTDNAQVRRTITDAYDFAPDAEHNDKF